MSTAAFKNLVYFWMLLTPVIFSVLLIVKAPYGRYAGKGWGPTISNKLGWMIMETASPAAFAFFFLQGGEKGLVNWIFFSLWMAHYFNRSIIYPMRITNTSKKMPLVICLSAIFFNLANGFLNGYFLGTFKAQYEHAWLTDIRFIGGAALFATGFLINLSSDNMLLNLRKGSKKGEYQIPAGGLFKWISCPNYLGEIIEWLGWALATWSLSGLSFALWTAANLIPRALAHHKWYRTRFKDYPPERKAILPHVI